MDKSPVTRRSAADVVKSQIWLVRMNMINISPNDLLSFACPSLNAFYGHFYQIDMWHKLKGFPQALVVNMKTQLSSHTLYSKHQLKANSLTTQGTVPDTSPKNNQLLAKYMKMLEKKNVKGHGACGSYCVSHVTLGQKCTFLRGEKPHMRTEPQRLLLCFGIISLHYYCDTGFYRLKPTDWAAQTRF